MSPSNWGRLFLCALLVLCVDVNAKAQGIISLNFSENSGNQGFTGGELIGPLETDSAFWNNTNGQPDLAAGTLINLIDDTGANTGVSVSWSSSNVWFNGDGTGDDEHRMSVGYLDDGAPGISITFSNIPYDEYTVYGLLASDQAAEYTSLDFTVNGAPLFGASFPAYGGIDNSQAATGQLWSLANGATPGNYWLASTSGSTLTISAPPRNGPERGSITGVIISEGPPPEPELMLSVDRDTGSMSLVNDASVPAVLAGYSVLSENGALLGTNWTSISGNYDAGGNGSVSSDNWLVFSSSPEDLSEGTLGSGTIAANTSVDLGMTWLQYFNEDLRFEFLDVETGNTLSTPVEFTGNDGQSYAAGDFNFDGLVDALDWPTVRDGFNSSLAGLPIAQAYRQGDITGDLAVNQDDLFAFKDAFDAANGAGAFDDMLAGVPEPSTCLLVVLGCGLALAARRRQIREILPVIVAAVSCVGVVGSIRADAVGVNFAGGSNGPGGSVNVTDLAGAFLQPNWNNALDATGSLMDVVDQSGAATSVDVTWTSANTWAGGGTPNSSNERLMVGWLDDGGDGARAQVRDVPYSQYDLYVYMNSDAGNGGRYGNVEIQTAAGANLIGPIFNGGWVDPSNPIGFFNGEFLRTPVTGTDTTLGSPPDGNYVVFEDLNLSEFDIFGASLFPAPGGGDARGAILGFQLVEKTTKSFQLTLEVDPATGATRFRNDGREFDFDIDYYQISSPSGSLNTAGWTSLQDQNLPGFPAGNGSGNGWEELGGLDSSLLAEFYLQGQSIVIDGVSASLGNAFSVTEGTPDLVFEYRLAGSNIMSRGEVVYGDIMIECDFDGDGVCDIDDLNSMLAQGPIAPGVPVTVGVNDQFDLNGDDLIDLADQNLWLASAATENGLGSPYKIGDANLDGAVDVTDFNSWNSNKFTMTLNWNNGDFNGDGSADVSDFNAWNGNKFTSSDGATVVPEPGLASAMVVVALMGLGVRRRCRAASRVH